MAQKKTAQFGSNLGHGRVTAADRAAHEASLRRLFPENYRREVPCPTPEQAWRAEQASAQASAGAEDEYPQAWDAAW